MLKMDPLNGVSHNFAVCKNVTMTLNEDLLYSLKRDLFISLTKRRGKCAMQLASRRYSLKSSVLWDVMPSSLAEVYNFRTRRNRLPPSSESQNKPSEQQNAACCFLAW
jgi:hypothetical protein